MEWHAAPSFLLILAMITINMAVPLIKAPWGALQGISVEGDGGRKMNAYLGIPYALPPVGDLRFEKPQPHPGPENGATFVADTVRPACPQPPMLVGASRKTSEDCLILDVFVPTDGDRDDGPLAVMIFIHGGGFCMGDAYTYRPSKLVVDGRVIVVTIQYRLGALGFLSTGDGTIPDNLGLWDQNLALRWVKDNIQAFGGDPSRITIFGESAGGMSVGLHVLSPQSRGLFHRGIMQSGAPGAFSFLSERLDMEAVFKDLADSLGCQGETTVELVTCLKQQTEEDVFNKAMQCPEARQVDTCFTPVFDGEFIPRDVKELIEDEGYLKENGVSDIDLIIGFNNKEAALIADMLVIMNMSMETLRSSAEFERHLDSCIFARGLNKNPVMKKTIEFYYRGAEFGADASETLDALVDLNGHCMLMMDILDWAKRLAAASSHSAGRYVYVFDHDFVFNQDAPLHGSFHGDELLLEFDNSLEVPDNFFSKIVNKTDIAPEEQPLSDMFVQILTSFAKRGDPNPPLRTHLDGDWPQFTHEDEAYLSLSLAPHVVTQMGPYRDHYALWTTFLPQLNDLTSRMPPEEPTKEQSSPKEAGQEDTVKEEL